MYENRSSVAWSRGKAVRTPEPATSDKVNKRSSLSNAFRDGLLNTLRGRGAHFLACTILFIERTDVLDLSIALQEFFLSKQERKVSKPGANSLVFSWLFRSHVFLFHGLWNLLETFFFVICAPPCPPKNVMALPLQRIKYGTLVKIRGSGNKGVSYVQWKSSRVYLNGKNASEVK